MEAFTDTFYLYARDTCHDGFFKFIYIFSIITSNITTLKQNKGEQIVPNPCQHTENST